MTKILLGQPQCRVMGRVNENERQWKIDPRIKKEPLN
jgi:hypothetical protein